MGRLGVARRPIIRRMHDTELYGKLLGLSEPWFVDRLEARLLEGRVDLWVAHREDVPWRCPECETVCALHDHAEERTWRHLDTMQYRTLVHARPPRVRCSEHGVRQVPVPWAEQRSRFTLLFECFAINVLEQTSVSGAQRILQLSWMEAWNIKRRAVQRGLDRKTVNPPKRIGVDEKATGKGHQYMTLVCDIDRGKITWVATDREAASLGGYFEHLGEGVKQIEAVAMDMWPAYLHAVREYVPDAESKIVYDRFHVAREIGQGLDRVRKDEHRALTRRGIATLKSTKYWWLSNKGNVPHKHRRAFVRLRERSLRTARAWAIKELLRRLWTYRTESRATTFWKRWYGWASRCRLVPVVKAAKKLRKNLRYILNYFRHRITNALSESLNAQIEKVKRLAQGYRNRDNLRIAIYFHCAGLDLYPSTHAKL